MIKTLLLSVSLCLSGGVFGASEPSVFDLISRQAKPPVIVVGTRATASEKFAAEELKTYLEKITGRPFTLVDDQKAPTGKFIAVGKNKLTDSLDISGLSEEQYVIEARPDCLIILGGRKPPLLGSFVRDRGTLYGVYDVLEQLGVRWYRPEPWGEFVPTSDTIRFPLGTTVSKVPAYEMRSGVAGGFTRYRKATDEETAWVRRWAVRNRLNWNEAGNDPKYGGHTYFTFGHAYNSIMPPEKYFKDHPNYYALIQGKRDPCDLCLGNPALQKVFAENVIATAKAQPQLSSISVEPNDGSGGLCECPLCRAMGDPKNPALYSNQVCAFSDIIARKLAAAVPGMRLHWLAYAGHTSVPTTVKRLEPNTIIQLCTINEWGDYSKKLFDPSSGWNKNFREALQGWSALKPSCIMTYEYWSGYGWLGPFPITHTIADRLRNYRQFNVRGIYNETAPSWGPQGLELYMFAKLIWNPDLDVDRELDLYYRNYYGPAAKPMKAYHELLMAATESPSHPSVFSGGRGMHLVFTPQVVDKMSRYMAQAQKAVKGQPLYERRLYGVWAGYEFSRRICEILKLKKQDGVKVDSPPPFKGRGSYLKSARAQKAYDELVKFTLQFEKGDAVFDVIPNVASLRYTQSDVMENGAYFYYHESDLLQDFARK